MFRTGSHSIQRLASGSSRPGTGVPPNKGLELTLRQAKLGEGGRSDVTTHETFRVSQQVKVLPGEGDHPPVASLAWWRGDSPCEA